MHLPSDPNLLSCKTSHREQTFRTEVAKKKSRCDAACCFLNIFVWSTTCFSTGLDHCSCECPMGSALWQTKTNFLMSIKL